jgi:ribosome maturation factor RimP
MALANAFGSVPATLRASVACEGFLARAKRFRYESARRTTLALASPGSGVFYALIYFSYDSFVTFGASVRRLLAMPRSHATSKTSRSDRGASKDETPKTSAYDQAVAEAAAGRSFEPVKQTPAAIAARVRTLTEEVIDGTSYFIVDVDVRGHKGTRVVQLYLDADDDFGHDDLSEVSREVSFLLDVEDVIDGGYKLEVSSPGIKRPLALPRQYPKNVGRTLRVKYTDEDGTTQTVVGDLLAAEGKAIELDDPSTGTPLVIPFDAIEEARIELPW